MAEGILFATLCLTVFSSSLVLGDQNPDTDPCRNKSSSDVDLNKVVLQCLLKSYDYGATLNRKTDVELSYRATDLFYVEGEQNRFFLFGEFELSWKDPNFVWTKKDYSIGRVLSRNVVNIWKPEIYLNDLSNFDTDRRMFRSPVISPETAGSLSIHNSGAVRYRYQRTLVALCPSQDLTHFPYDVKTCRIELFAPGNVSFVKTKPEDTFGFDEELTTQHVLGTNVTFNDLDDSVAKSAVTLSVTFVRHEEAHNVRTQTPNLGLCLFFLLPLWLSPSSVLRLILPTISFLFTLYQMQQLNETFGATLYAGPILILNFYQAITILSMGILIHNFISSLIWKRKVFLPPFLNRMYSQLYSMEWYKNLTEAQNYLEIEQESSENSENLEATFHTWSELLRLMDLFLFVILVPVEMYYFVPATKVL